MKRLIYDPDKASFVFGDWIPEVVHDYGVSCAQKKKFIPTSARINNKEVQGTSRVALYTFPDGKDSGVRLNPLYEINGLDVTEMKAIENNLKVQYRQAEEAITEEFNKNVEAAVKTANAKSSVNKSSVNKSSSTQSASE